MSEFAIAGFEVFNATVLVYFLVLNTIYLALTVIAARAVSHRMRRTTDTELDEIFANPMTPGVSVVVPAYNEELGIVDCVRSILALRYPKLEVVVVDDGSTDETFALLRQEWDLEEVHQVLPHDVPHIGAVRSVHRSRTGAQIVVVRKDNTGRRSDPVNVGINAARNPLVAVTDADSVLDADSMLHMVKPYLEDPARTVAVGGTIRVVNGTAVAAGELGTPRQPKSWLARVQVLEYLRSFLVGRVGWAEVDGLLIVSGAFGLFRRDVLVRVDGLDLDSLAEDAELITRIHRRMRDTATDYRIAFSPEPVCWTEVPGTVGQLRRQRRRWSHGLADLLSKHREMIGNRRYGRIGVVVLPYYLLFELLGAVLEMTGFLVVAAGLYFGLIDVGFMLLFLAVAWLYGVMVSVAALAIEEFSYHRYSRWRDLGAALLASVFEVTLFRPMHAFWRLEGLVLAVRGTAGEWDALERAGFVHESEPVPVAA